MVPDTLRGFWDEPAVPDPPERTRWDRILVAAVLVLGVLESLDDTSPWPAARLASALAVALVVSQRRTKPLRTTLVAIGAYGGVGVAMLATGVEGALATSLVLPVILYALGRWASGRQVVLGVALSVPVAVVLLVTDPEGDAVWTVLFWLGPVLVASAIRSRVNLGAQRMREARLSERQRIARELHDSVAHHVSGIAIQAKAAQAVAATDPAAAARAMATVEAQASRTLTEMRAMVGALREDDEPGPVAQRGVDDIVRLAGAGYAGPRVQVDLAGDLDALDRSTEAGLFRIAQESITNARRHARNASRIAVRIVGAGDEVELTITDDGDPIPASTHTGVGYGLAGMSERAALLGGTFEAGPGSRRGWITRAVLPRRGNAP